MAAPTRASMGSGSEGSAPAASGPASKKETGLRHEARLYPEARTGIVPNRETHS